jgi:hypothetical protein
MLQAKNGFEEKRDADRLRRSATVAGRKARGQKAFASIAGSQGCSAAASQ